MATDPQMEAESVAADGMPGAVDGMPMAADEGAFTTAPFKGGVKITTQLESESKPDCQIDPSREPRLASRRVPQSGRKPWSTSKGKRYRVWERDGGSMSVI